MTGVAERLWGTIEPYVAAEGVELDDVEVLGGGQIVRVTLDADEPVGVDMIAELSRGIGRLLDADDPINDAYTLEVSSPGLERKLSRQRHYEKSIGRQVKVKTFAPVSDEKSHTGVLVSADGDAFVIEVDGESRQITYGDVSSARTVFVWDKTSPKEKDA